MNINGREISQNMPPYMVAEISCNHGGDIGKAKALIEAAHQAGADAVKFQTYKPEDLTTRHNRLTWELYMRAMTPREWHAELFAHAKALRLTAFSSPFSVDAVQFLEREVNPPCYKIASPEALRDDLVKAVAKTGNPVIVSTGALDEMGVRELDSRLGPNVCFLHCVAQYPSDVEQANLNAITILRRMTRLVGLSDHSRRYLVPVAATALGAVMIEKHLKLDNDCIDADWSLDPVEFATMVGAVKAIWHGMGDGRIVPTCGSRKQVVANWENSAA